MSCIFDHTDANGDVNWSGAVDSLNRLVRDKGLPAVIGVGKSNKYRRAALDEWIEQRAAETHLVVPETDGNPTS